MLGQAYNRCGGIMVVIEPGTPYGFGIVGAAAKSFTNKATLLAPYIDNAFVQSNDFFLHFPQRFIRPEFQRRVRAQMRDDSLSPSDWEEGKYSYVAISSKMPQENYWGRVVGPAKKQKGFIELSILTKDAIVHTRVMKRNKNDYLFAKKLRWGDLIKKREDLFSE